MEKVTNFNSTFSW